MRSIFLFAWTALAAVAMPQAEPIARDGKYYMFVGTRTGQASKGVYAYRFDSVTGKAEPIGLVAEAASPVSLTSHPTEDYLYTANQAAHGAVTSFKINRETGKLTQVNQLPVAGSGPCRVSVDGTGRMLISAHCDDGSIAAYPLKEDGSIGTPVSTIKFSGRGPHQRQATPHASSASFSIDNRFLFVTDFGTDKVMSYKVDAAAAKLTPGNPPFATGKPGGGPLRFQFHPSGKFAYVLNEITSAVTVLRYDAATGKLSELQSIGTRPDASPGTNTGSDMQVHPSGMFLYAANRGDDNLAVFRIDETNGKLTPLGHTKTGGKGPRHFRVSPDGKWLIAANQDSNSMVFFRIDANTGLLTPSGDTLALDQPVSIRFVPVTDAPAGGRGGRGRGGAPVGPPAPGRGGRGQ
jgi:6-phosphogluconolactonase